MKRSLAYTIGNRFEIVEGSTETLRRLLQPSGQEMLGQGPGCWKLEEGCGLRAGLGVGLDGERGEEREYWGEFLGF